MPIAVVGAKHAVNAREHQPAPRAGWGGNPMTANGASYETAPPPNCPKCGKPLNVYRLLQIANDQREPFEFYLCHQHGFFLHAQ